MPLFIMVLLLPFISLILGAPFLTGINYHLEVKAPSCTSDALFNPALTFPPPWAAVLLKSCPWSFLFFQLFFLCSCPPVAQLSSHSFNYHQCVLHYDPQHWLLSAVCSRISPPEGSTCPESTHCYSSLQAPVPSHLHRLSQPTLPPSSLLDKTLFMSLPGSSTAFFSPSWTPLASPRTTCPHSNSMTT